MPFLARQHFTSVSKQCSTFNEIWILDRTPTPRPGLIFWGKKCTEDYSPTDNDNAFGISLVPLKEHMLRVDLLPRENALFNMSILYKLIVSINYRQSDLPQHGNKVFMEDSFVWGRLSSLSNKQNNFKRIWWRIWPSVKPALTTQQWTV